jgi:hypothetical protein
LAYIPRKGDTVMVHARECYSNGETVVPAIVTQVFNEHDKGNPTRCNLTAFPPFMTPQYLGSVEFFDCEPAIPDATFYGCWPKHEGHHHVGEEEQNATI